MKKEPEIERSPVTLESVVYEKLKILKKAGKIDQNFRELIDDAVKARISPLWQEFEAERNNGKDQPGVTQTFKEFQKEITTLKEQVKELPKLEKKLSVMFEFETAFTQEIEAGEKVDEINTNLEKLKKNSKGYSELVVERDQLHQSYMIAEERHQKAFHKLIAYTRELEEQKKK